ncbi:response regulator [Deinococcus peraridilitoris]|uniref:Response regulator with CheY-like receiver, AAA-type ATPase, and DNA-binding domains n=1 Tax=Deinococcus peraridilitoris (strain DSM 19664 / LMG 22246 / CIP 109416 / KR-200) TaxID=937777 RepID=L0A8J3_DEIPD|nr:response regulator [Deinococcus peraridilitoris]AFZ69487.1 response regulator with CheY-like receiver, AAA-type ATPase, and DNA-binding domains [Deinococcus peraridilitoris DSM 19664]
MRRVLLIEDHDADALLLVELLELVGADWQVEHVQTFAEAARCWPGGAFDVLLLDLDIPDGFGLEVLSRALLLAAGKPVVVLSGLANPEVAVSAVQLGARGYVVKGFGSVQQLMKLEEPLPMSGGG